MPKRKLASLPGQVRNHLVHLAELGQGRISDASSHPAHCRDFFFEPCTFRRFVPLQHSRGNDLGDRTHLQIFGIEIGAQTLHDLKRRLIANFLFRDLIENFRLISAGDSVCLSRSPQFHIPCAITSTFRRQQIFELQRSWRASSAPGRLGLQLCGFRPKRPGPSPAGSCLPRSHARNKSSRKFAPDFSPRLPQRQECGLAGLYSAGMLVGLFRVVDKIGKQFESSFRRRERHRISIGKRQRIPAVI